MSDVTDTSATLHARGSCDGTPGKPCYFRFEYVTGGIVKRGPMHGPVTGSTNGVVPIDEPISGLQPATTYQARFCGKGDDNVPDWTCANTVTFTTDVTSAPDVARYDDAPSWNGGANCSGGLTPGAKRMQDWLRANWGSATIQGYSCRPNTANLSKTSIHGVGRANDWFRDAGNATHRAQVDSFIARMSANGAAMARATGVQFWVWNRKKYSVQGTSVLPPSPYTGPIPHTDHVHIEQNIAGSRLETSYWRLAGG